MNPFWRLLAAVTLAALLITEVLLLFKIARGNYFRNSSFFNAVWVGVLALAVGYVLVTALIYVLRGKRAAGKGPRNNY